MNYLGIDGGGSKTAFLLEDESGNEIGRCETGPSNWLSAGEDEARRNIAAGIQQLGIVPDVVCGGFAGAGRPEGVAFYTACLSALLPKAKLFVETDAFISYIGAIGLEPGVLLIAGTGSIAIGRRADGSMIRVGGWGPIFSDEGSGFWIGKRVLQNALRSHDTRIAGENEQDVELIASICETLQLGSITDVSAAWKSGALTVRSVASLANLIFTKYAETPSTLSIGFAAGFHLKKIMKAAVAQVGIPDCRRSITGSIGKLLAERKFLKIECEAPLHPPERGAITWARSEIRAQAHR